MLSRITPGHELYWIRVSPLKSECSVDDFFIIFRWFRHLTFLEVLIQLSEALDFCYWMVFNFPSPNSSGFDVNEKISLWTNSTTVKFYSFLKLSCFVPNCLPQGIAFNFFLMLNISYSCIFFGELFIQIICPNFIIFEYCWSSYNLSFLQYFFLNCFAAFLDLY